MPQARMHPGGFTNNTEIPLIIEESDLENNEMIKTSTPVETKLSEEKSSADDTINVSRDNYKIKAPSKLTIPIHGGEQCSNISAEEKIENQSVKSPKSPRSPKSPSFKRQLQTVAAGLHFIKHTKSNPSH